MKKKINITVSDISRQMTNIVVTLFLWLFIVSHMIAAKILKIVPKKVMELKLTPDSKKFQNLQSAAKESLLSIAKLFKIVRFISVGIKR